MMVASHRPTSRKAKNPSTEKDAIAIIGVGCRFPGGINDKESLWKLLIEGREAVGEVPPDRWNVQRFYDSEPGIAGKSIAKRAGFVDGIDQFDPQFFGISPREAPYVDPQHRRETMGYCSGNVPIRGEVQPGRSLEESVRETHLTAIDAFANAMPFVELVRALGDLPSASHNPVFDIRFALQNHPIPDITVPGMSVQLRMRSTGTARFDLGCEITESGDELEVVWVYRSKLFSRTDVESIGGLFLAVMETIAATPESCAAALTA